MPDPTGIFISYRRSDTHWAAISLRHSLERAFPSAKLFYDGDSLKAGVKWPDRLRRGLTDCGVLLALIGTRWATERDEKDIRRRLDIEEDWVRNEIAFALEHGKAVIPILIDDTALPSDPTDLPHCLRPLLDCQATAFRRSDDKADLEKLTARLHELLPEAASATPPAPPNPQPRPAPAPPGTIAIDAAADLIAEAAADETTLGAIGVAQVHAGRYAISEALFRRAHASLQEKRGAEDVQTLTARANHATAILLQGRAVVAEAMFRDLLPLREKVIGSEHPDTLTTRFYLARATLDQGRAAEAEAMNRDLLPLQDKVKGPEHPNTLTTRDSLASAALDQGRTAEAETLWRDLLPLQERVMGPEHPETLTARNNLAAAVLEQGRAAEAEALWRDLLPLLEKVRGPEHPDTLTTRANLASAALDQGRTAEAEALFDTLLPLNEKVSGLEHPVTLLIRFGLARAALNQGRAAEAEEMFRDMLPVRGKVSGPEHPDTLTIRRFIAWAALEQGAVDRAREGLDALPDDSDAPPLHKARTAMLRGWLADLDGGAGAATVLLDQADALLSDLPPEHHMRRNLAKYRETRVPGGTGSTMLWAQDRDR